MCSVSIYIPQPPQCFLCQVLGHQATECSAGEDQCGRCTGPHLTSQHTCLYDAPCPTGQRCDKEHTKCTNCKGAHPSWLCSCLATKFALGVQVHSPTYCTYEAHTPFMFADTLCPRFKPWCQHGATSSSPLSVPLPSPPDINMQQATSPAPVHD